MNDQEKSFFLALSKDRSEIADILNRRAVRGYKDSVVEKYSDQAHFIYELLQNADDACATSARFILEKDRLIFAHNGKRHFSISDPATEDMDSENNTLGDINAITSIANSNKTGSSIGKFGVGFKAVFQYTETPHIYDPSFRFKIDQFIVPVLLDQDFPDRRPDETLFLFPFNHPNRSSEEAYEDISDKLQHLCFPLLFLTVLESIEFKFSDIHGFYGKRIKKSYLYSHTTAEQLYLEQNNGNELSHEELWLFSRLDEHQRRYSVGFFLDEFGHLKPVNEPAFCFFPTKEVTALNFILHAPFLLTDSREGIRAGIAHNDNMIQLLADLAADSLEYLNDIGHKESISLIEDNIVFIIPVDPEKFSEPTDKRKISFKPFYTKIKAKLEMWDLLPSTDGCVAPENAYWAEFSQLPQLFSNSQLALITENENAHWVFTSISRSEINRNNKALFAYLDSLIRKNINEDTIISGRSKLYFFNRALGIRQSSPGIKGITASFIEAQNFKWLHRFYKWLSETKHRSDISRTKPFFLNQNRKAVPAFDEKNQLVLFLPVKDVDGYPVVHPELLKNPDTKQFMTDLGIKAPSLRDQIYNTVLPLYKSGKNFDTNPHFKLFFQYFCKCSNDTVDEFIDLIKDYQFLAYYNDGIRTYTKASELYMPTPELVKFFASKPSTHFIDFNGYLALVGTSQHENLTSFLYKLGIKRVPFVYHIEKGNRNNKKSEYIIDGLQECIDNIVETKNADASIFLWTELCEFIESGLLDFRVQRKTIMTRPDARYNFKFEYEPSSTIVSLKNKPWILTDNGTYTSAECVTQSHLNSGYDLDSENAKSLLALLDIADDNSSPHGSISEDDDSNLTDLQKEKIALADKLSKYGIENEDDLAEFQEFRRKKIAAKKAAQQEAEKAAQPSDSTANTTEDTLKSLLSDMNQGEPSRSRRSGKRASQSATNNVIKDIVQRTNHTAPSAADPEPEFEDVDEDEFIPSPVDYHKKIEHAKEKSAAEIDRIAYFEELQDRALQLTQDAKYSVAWFKTLLEMECINGSEANANSKEISISFARVERELNTQRTLILKYPNRYIPQFMEDLADIPLVLHSGDSTKTLAIEVANIKSYTLRVKIKNGSDIDSIDFNSVTAATIDAKSPVFLLEELKNQFNALDLENDFNLKNHLCENIEFIFGPPGTGKTTHLAKKVLLPLMEQDSACKVLVLTPTNKSADVLVKRIMDVSASDSSYENWLVRFGGTADEEIEQSSVFKDKTFDIRTLSKSVTITTIARFPYDFFMPQGSRVFLQGINWDYIVIDEASMIPIANIIFPLYKKTPKKFIIAGDPFQIEPITSVDIWKNETIYTMVELNSFVNPKTKPFQYKTELLTTQYRSIPEIGEIFSQFTYGGILNHHRSASSQRELNVGNDLGIETLNIIKYPVSKYESIYRSKRLNHSSSYQIYSALFTFEYVRYLSAAISKNNPSSRFKIGIIAPYRAQADMIDKLLASEELPPEVEVQVGTIHGFQGDECDIIFAVFNTPPTISSSNEMFLNKRNIINVSISRARDYLFIVMPDDNTEGISNLRLVKKVERLIHNADSWNEFLSSDLEDLMFDDSSYLEKNTFSTGHQSVNVYGLPEKRYEVRTEDNAIDIQIHKDAAPSSTSLFSEDNEQREQQSILPSAAANPVTLKKQHIDIIDFLNDTGTNYIDKRSSGGNLWIIGGQELAEIVVEAAALGYTFYFKADGGRATKSQPGWWSNQK